MASLLQELAAQLEPTFAECTESEQFQANLNTLADQLQRLITIINQNGFVRDVLPDIGIANKITVLQSLARETAQIGRNCEAVGLATTSLDKEIKRRKRVLRKLKRGAGSVFTRTAIAATNSEDDEDGGPEGQDVSEAKSSRFSLRLPTLRTAAARPASPFSIPMPPPLPVRFRFDSDSSTSRRTTAATTTTTSGTSSSTSTSALFDGRATAAGRSQTEFHLV